MLFFFTFRGAPNFGTSRISKSNKDFWNYCFFAALLFYFIILLYKIFQKRFKLRKCFLMKAHQKDLNFLISNFPFSRKLRLFPISHFPKVLMPIRKINFNSNFDIFSNSGFSRKYSPVDVICIRYIHTTRVVESVWIFCQNSKNPVK